MQKTPKQIARTSTGVPGLDDILNGGFPSNRLYLIQGDPGVGKTTLALQFLLDGAQKGEKGLYITLSETKDEVQVVADSHGWDLDAIHMFELSAVEEQLASEASNTFFHPSEVDLNRTTKAFLAEVDRVKPARVVFDSLSEMRMLADTPLRYRRQILQLKQYFAGRKITVLFLDDRSADQTDLQVESIAHGVICIQKSSPEYGASRRRLSVVKIRGSAFREGFHDLILREGGMTVFPRLVAAEHHTKFVAENFASGIAGLDALLGGGLARGNSTMFMGPPGTGKSTLAAKFAHAAAQRGEKVLMFIFDETVETLTRRAAQLGLDMAPHIASGMLQVQQVDPAELSPGELAARIRNGVSGAKARMVIIDSINGYLKAMPEERFLTLQLHELLSYLNQQGVITILVLAQQGLVGSMQSAVDLTYLADTVVVLRYFEMRGAVRQAVSIIKKRGGDHERTIREIKVSKSGITVGEPLENLQGVLTGVPGLIDPPAQAAATAK